MKKNIMLTRDPISVESKMCTMGKSSGKVKMAGVKLTILPTEC